MRKRAIFMIVSITFCLFLLIARLAQIQLISAESFTSDNINLLRDSVAQRTEEFIIDQGRGKFVDRHGKSLTYDYIPSLVLFPFLKNMDWPIEKVADIIDVPVFSIQQALKDAKEPIVYGQNNNFMLTEAQMEEINDLKIPGVFAVNRQYDLHANLAEHLIGITGENEDLFAKRYPEKKGISPRTLIGITGLQSTFDEFLLSEGEQRLIYHVDGNGGPLFGIEVKYSEPANPFYPVMIKTTLDKDYQIAAEETIKKFGLKEGGLILLDIENSEILASVSVPAINRRNPFGDGSVKNRMLIPQFPGSIFKTVIAAAAIEKNLVDKTRTFDCNLNLYGEPSEDHQYGLLTFTESFARSCNYTFATLGAELIEKDANIIEKYADKLGLLDPVGWRGDVYHFHNFSQIPGEYKGTVWGDERDKQVKKAIAQTSIGQKEVKISPLAIANMMATIARGGRSEQVKAVSEILYKNGNTLFSFKDQRLQDDTISPYTVMRLQQLLREVVTSDVGTGRRFQSLPYTVAGKSGTAETGHKNSENQPLVNKWFAGYFPVENPKYALVVVDLNQVGQKAVTNDVFYEYVKRIYDINIKSR